MNLSRGTAGEQVILDSIPDARKVLLELGHDVNSTKDRWRSMARMVWFTDHGVDLRTDLDAVSLGGGPEVSYLSECLVGSLDGQFLQDGVTQVRAVLCPSIGDMFLKERELSAP